MQEPRELLDPIGHFCLNVSFRLYNTMVSNRLKNKSVTSKNPIMFLLCV